VSIEYTNGKVYTYNYTCFLSELSSFTKQKRIFALKTKVCKTFRACGKLFCIPKEFVLGYNMLMQKKLFFASLAVVFTAVLFFVFLPSSVAAQTLFVTPSANPNSGAAPLGPITVSFTLTGTATGSYNWSIDWRDGPTDSCFNTGGVDTVSPKTIATKCTYNAPGTYSPLVTVTRQGITRSASTLVTVTSGASPPQVFTDPATSITSTGATLRGEVTSSISVDVWFVYAPALSFPSNCSVGMSGITTPTSSFGPVTDQPFSRAITGLTAGRDYRFCAFARNSANTVVGSVQSFTTSGGASALNAVIGFQSASGLVRDFTGASSFGGTKPYSATWDYGHPGGTDTGIDPGPHTFPGPGSYTVTLTLTDTSSPQQTDTATLTVVISGGPGGGLSVQVSRGQIAPGDDVTVSWSLPAGAPGPCRKETFRDGSFVNAVNDMWGPGPPLDSCSDASGNIAGSSTFPLTQPGRYTFDLSDGSGALPASAEVVVSSAPPGGAVTVTAGSVAGSGLQGTPTCTSADTYVHNGGDLDFTFTQTNATTCSSKTGTGYVNVGSKLPSGTPPGTITFRLSGVSDLNNVAFGSNYWVKVGITCSGANTDDAEVTILSESKIPSCRTASEPSCTASLPPTGGACAPGSGVCSDDSDCVGDPAGPVCQNPPGLCVPACTPGSCNVGFTCNTTTGHCDPSGPGGPVGPVGPTLPSITNIQFKNPLKVGSLTELINRLIDFIFTVSLIVAPILLVIAGVVFMTAAGDSSRVGTARRMLMWTIVGFGIILISKGLVEVLRGILGVTGPAP